MPVERISEHVSSRGLKLHVDREKGVIPGVKILGWESRNGRSYLQSGVAKAIPLYEGAKVNVDHAPSGNANRGYRDRIGKHINIRAEADGLYSDFQFNPKHALAEQLCWDAEHAPENVGFSHVVEAKVARKNGKAVVEEITKVISVDLVSDPATTKGLFESEQDILESDPALRSLAENSFSAADQIRSIIFAEGQSVDQKKASLADVLATWRAELNAGTTQNHQGADVDIKTLTVEELRSARPDLLEQIQGTDATSRLKAATDEIATLKAKIAEGEAAKVAAEKTAKIAEEVKAAFGARATDKKIVSEAFMAQLTSAADEAARKVLIEDRKALVGVTREATTQVPTTGAPPMAALSEGTETSGKPVAMRETLSNL